MRTYTLHFLAFVSILFPPKLYGFRNEEGRVIDLKWFPWLWHRRLGELTNSSTLRDPVLEQVIKTGFREYVKPSLMAGDALLGLAVLDPLWLYPVGPALIRKPAFRGDIKACDLHLHNLRNAEMTFLEVRRDPEFKFMAVRVYFKLPIAWMTGRYELSRALLLKFIPAGARGSFNIDFKEVIVGVINIIRLGDPDHPDDSNVNLERFEMGMSWSDLSVKFDGGWKGFGKLADFTLNKLKVFRTIVKKKKQKIMNEIEPYLRQLHICLLKSLSDGGVKLCMRQWWIDQGWSYPWQPMPTCS